MKLIIVDDKLNVGVITPEELKLVQAAPDTLILAAVAPDGSALALSQFHAVISQPDDNPATAVTMTPSPVTDSTTATPDATPDTPTN